MNQVVNFLSLLAVTEEQGGVKRMLGVCAEFERIARVVLDRSDKDSHSRRKKRSSPPPTSQQHIPQKRPATPTPQTTNAPTPQNIFTPNFNNDLNNQPFSPLLQTFSPSMTNIDLGLDLSNTNFNPNLMSASNGSNGGMEGFQTGDMNGQAFSGDGLGIPSFQQPFIPQDLWQMPMALEWDWADLGSEATPGTFGGEQRGDQVMNGIDGSMG